MSSSFLDLAFNFDMRPYNADNGIAGCGVDTNKEGRCRLPV
jgi:hypothetical protein